MILTTQFIVRDGDGPAVTASRQGGDWSFKWKGGGGLLRAISHAQAEKVAQGLAERLSEIEPLRAELDARQDDLGEWLNSQQEPT